MHTPHRICYKNVDVWRSPKVASENLVMNLSMEERFLFVTLFYKFGVVDSALATLKIGWLVGFNVGLKLHRALVNDHGLIPKDDLEACHHSLDPTRKGRFSRFGAPRSMI